MNFRNIAIFGASGSGKSAASNYLVTKYGYQHCHPGAICREISYRLFRDDSKALLNKVNDCMRAIEPNVWLLAALRECATDQPIVVDGMRFKTNFTYLRSLNYWFWKLDAHQLVRQKRLESRGQKFDWQTDVAHSGEIELSDMSFDVIIDNSNRDLSRLHARIDELMRCDG